jgi:dTDP-4-dehydrorhamnose 3,5-epimerase
MIDGVIVKKLRVIPDERGRLSEILRSDDDIFGEFGQVYMTTAYPGVVKAWHYHKEQTDCIAVIHGMMKIVLFDNRKDSPTYKEINEFFAGIYNPVLIKIPKLIYHGFKCISEVEAIAINIPNRTYNYDNPDEFRIDPYENDIPYDWSRKDG